MDQLSTTHRTHRRSGILLHITSLPSKYGIGDLGPNAYEFADFLWQARQRIWQILPLTPIDPVLGNSPYNSSSAFAGNKYLISPELMVRDGLLASDDIKPMPNPKPNKVEYRRMTEYKNRLLDKAFEKFNNYENKEKFKTFCSENAYWLEDFVLFSACKKYFDGKVWNAWPVDIRDRVLDAIEKLQTELKDELDKERFYQFLFFKQWYSLKQFCNDLDIRIIGDMPIYVDYNSPDVWSKPYLFKLNDNKKPAYIAGVPPDYFSKTGQLWGNPVYNWDIHKKDGYQWWLKRIEHNLKMYDQVRIDHFRGFVQYWEVEGSEKTALNGHWEDGPGEELFNAMLSRHTDLPIIAEDLGIITPDVIELREKFAIPGLKVLLFAFNSSKDTNPYLPHKCERNCVVYTGTHDNNTVKGWIKNDASEIEMERLTDYLGEKINLEEINWKLIELAMASKADYAIIPMQDILGLGQKSRMNTPSKSFGNWEWRLSGNELTPQLADNLKNITVSCGRD
jgi:4-alpha-glucanotransferase